MTAETTAVTECTRCGQPLTLISPGRDVCERCRLGRTAEAGQAAEVAKAAAAAEAEAKAAIAGARQPCKSCGRSETDAGHVLGVADGYCLSCRVEGKHLQP
ncbi:hypothetical protein [Pseudonocardia spinosispora]|uniref:hypothetical protein n=1 Tax=Pseudonocardia spinosispora TaxID=103441 RepID=UPI0004264111|nr:hypothetical protein [Pseudonocardia spinosispora]